MGETFSMPIMGRMKRLGVYTWPVTKEHRARADRNHGQTLERLRERGGVYWTELYCILQNKDLFDVVHNAEAQEKVRYYYVDELKGDWKPTDAQSGEGKS